jgi:hypothetical protein
MIPDSADRRTPTTRISQKLQPNFTPNTAIA